MANDHLGQTWLDVTAKAAALGLKTFPASPIAFPAALVAEWPGDDWAAFIEIAATTGCPLLYVSGRAFGYHPDLAIFDITSAVRADGADDRPSTIDPEAASIGALEIAFTAGGVLHQFNMSCGWFDDLEQQIQEAADEHDPRRGSFVFGDPKLEAEIAAELERLKPLIDEVAERTASSPGFLAATSYSQRRAILDEDKAVMEWRRADGLTAAGRAAFQARTAAGDAADMLAEQARAALVADAVAQLDSLVKQLQDDADYQAAGLAKARQRATKAFVARYLGFGSTDLSDRLYSAAQRARTM